MAIHYVLDKEGRWFEVIAEGVVTYPEIVAHLKEERDDDLLPHHEIIEGKSATLSLSADEVRRVVQLLRELGGENALGPTAVVVRNDVSFGIMRMLEILLEDVCDIRPFRDRDRAEEWLLSIPSERSR